MLKNNFPALSEITMNISTDQSLLCVGNNWFPVTPGGLDRYVYELNYQLARQGNIVELCGIGLPISKANYPVKLTNLANPKSSLLKRLWQTHQNFKHRQLTQPNGINLHFALYSFPLLSSFPKNVPITFTFHGPWTLESQREGGNFWGTWTKYWIEKKVYQRCDRFIVLSQAFGEILHQNYQIPWDKIHIIPGGVDTTQFQSNLSRKQARDRLNWSTERPIIFTPRRLAHRMGLSQLLKAIALIKPKVPEVWLAIAGKGSLQEILKQQVVELGLSHHVKFLGYLPDEQLPIAYQAADLTIVPSQSLEGFGLIILESLACGTPVICTPVGGMPEILTPFSPELITDSIHENAIATKLIDVLTREIRLPSRMTCCDYVNTQFDWSKIAPKVKKVLLA